MFITCSCTLVHLGECAGAWRLTGSCSWSVLKCPQHPVLRETYVLWRFYNQWVCSCLPVYSVDVFWRASNIKTMVDGHNSTRLWDSLTTELNTRACNVCLIW
jgi:hypothetical protein